MLKKTFAVAIAATLFACSSSDDDGDNSATSSSSRAGSGGSSSSATPNEEPSSSSTMTFTILHDFEEQNDNTIGYVLGGATLENDCVPPEEGEEECSTVDAEGQPYRNWTPNGIFTLKNFSYNGETDLAVNGGGLIIKGLTIGDYASIKFDAKSSADGRHSFRVKATKGGNEAAIRHFFEPSTTTLQAITVEINSNNFQKDYNDTDLSDAALADYVLKNATEVEFIIPVGRFSPNTSDTKHTLEIDNFAVALK